MKGSRNKSTAETVSVGNVTVRIYRRDRQTTTGKSRTVYEVADYSTGKRRLRGFTDHKEATTEARRIARTLGNGNAQAAMLRNADAASYGRALELLRPTGVKLEVAAAAFAEAFKLLEGNAILEAARFFKAHRPALARRSVAEVAEEFMASKRNQSPPYSTSYLKDLEYRLGRFRSAFTGNIASITAPEVQRFLDEIPNAQSRRKTRTIIGGLFDFAQRRGYVGKGLSPIQDTEKPKPRTAPKEVFTPKEIKSLLKAAPPNYLPVLAIGAFAGIRRQEILRLQWSDIDLEAGRINIPRHKAKGGRKPRLVPVLPSLKAWLLMTSDRTGAVWKMSEGSLEKVRKATVAAAGVDWKDNGLRDSFISYRLAATQAEQTVALEAGNSPDVVFNHYRTVVTPEAAEEYFRVFPEPEGGQ